MIGSQRARVRPRVVAIDSGEQFLLEDEVRRLVESGQRGVVQLYGGPGSGKSTALAHLAAVLEECQDIAFVDDAKFRENPDWSEKRLVVCSTENTIINGPVSSWRLVDWSTDELIEYVLATCKPACAAVMSRLSPEMRSRFTGSPEIWHAILDELISDPELQDPAEAIIRAVGRQAKTPAELKHVSQLCLEALVGVRSQEWWNVAGKRVPLIRHREVQLVLAASELARQIRDGRPALHLKERLPRPLIKATGAQIAGDEQVREYLLAATAAGTGQQSMAVSLLLAAGFEWVPDGNRKYDLHGATLGRASLPGVILRSASIGSANLSGADLSGAILDLATAASANLSRADLQGASMCCVSARFANLELANLSGVDGRTLYLKGANLRGARFDKAKLEMASFVSADLTGANFRRAKLSQALFLGATLEEVDFTEADLEGVVLAGNDLRTLNFEGASLQRAYLSKCNLEGMDLNGIFLQDADLDGALLTEACLKGAILQGASLREAGLAEIDAEGADFRKADFWGATFHMGSTRDGLLFSPFASEGSRTGFYTDDFDEQTFKAPEEIRKANLRGADLRGADITGVDFYLVDLRDALYDARQERQFRRTGAILEDPVSE